MKNTLKAVLFFVLLLIILTAFFFGAYAGYLASGFSLLSIHPETEDFWALALSGPALLFPLILSLALFLLFLLRLRTRPGLRPLTCLLLLLLSLGFLGAGGFLYQGRGPGDVVSGGELYFEPGMIYGLPGEQNGVRRQIYIGQASQTQASQVILPEGEDLPPEGGKLSGAYHLEYYPTGRQEGQNLILNRRGGGQTRVNLFEPPEENPGGFGAAPAPRDSLTIPALPMTREDSPELLVRFARLGLSLLALKDIPRAFFLSLLAVSLYGVSVWGFIRISRWPFFNAIIVFFLLAGSEWLYRIFSDPVMAPVIRMTQGLRGELPLWAAALGLSGILLLIIDILFIPYKKRMKEESDE
jgi:hypothetical protein